MNARGTAQKNAAKLNALLARIQEKATAIPEQPHVHWGHAGQLEGALEHAVYAAFSLGVVTEDEAREFGYRV